MHRLEFTLLTIAILQLSVVFVTAEVSTERIIPPNLKSKPLNTIELCTAPVISHCQNAGYSFCKSVDSKEQCYCTHTANYTTIDEILKHDLSCNLVDTRYLDPHYWFRDLQAATLAFVVIFGLIFAVFGLLMYYRIQHLHLKEFPGHRVSITGVKAPTDYYRKSKV